VYDFLERKGASWCGDATSSVVFSFEVIPPAERHVYPSLHSGMPYVNNSEHQAGKKPS
jgi:hypothetical protein